MEGNIHVLKFAKNTPNAFSPTKETNNTAGFILYSAYNYMIPANGKCLIQTDLKIAVPAGYYACIAPMTGLKLKNFIDIRAGIIDSDYGGNINIVLFNFGEKEFKINYGDPIAQLILEKIHLVTLEESNKLKKTPKAKEFFNSTHSKIYGEWFEEEHRQETSL